MSQGVFTKAAKQVVAALLNSDAWKATKYVGPGLVVKATRKRFHGKIVKRGSAEDIVLSIGRPNYLEQKFIKACKSAGEPFPVRKVQFRAVPRVR